MENQVDRNRQPRDLREDDREQRGYFIATAWTTVLVASCGVWAALVYLAFYVIG